MDKEERLRFFRWKLQELADKEGISFEELTEKAELGELALNFWKEEGKEKLPKEVLRADIAELVSKVRRLAGSVQ